MLLVLFAMIPAIGIMAHEAIFERREAARRAQHEALNLARLAAQQQSQMVAITHQLLQSLTLLPEMRSPRKSEACHRILAGLLALHSYYSNLGVAAPDGRVFCSALPMTKSVNIADRDYFRRAMGSRDFAAGTYQIGRITGVSSVNFGQPVLDATGKPRSVVFAALNLSWLGQIVARVDLPAGSTLTVVDSHGTILARYPDPAKWVGRSMTDSPLVKAMTSHDGEGTTEAVGMDGRERLYAFAPLYKVSSGNAAYVGIGIAKETAFAAVDRKFVRDLSLLVLVAVLALTAAWAGSNRFVLRRVQVLTAAARRFGQGDLAVRTGLPHGDEEIGRLARTFDEMAGALEARTRQIDHAQHELQRVNRALRTQSAGNQCLLRATDEQGLLDEMCRVIVETGGYRAAWVGYALEDEYKTVRPMAQAGHAGGIEKLRELKVVWSDTEHGRGAVGTAIRTGRPRVIRDTLAEPDFAPWRDVARRHDYTSVAAFPLRAHGKTVGAIAIYSSEPDAFDRDEMKVLEETAHDLIYGIEALRLRAAHERANETIQRMAYFDALTGLPNHTQFEERLKDVLQTAERQNRSAAILLADLDRFREINDALGFQQGNALIKEMGARLEAAAREAGTVARMRGDEFAVLLPDAGDESAVQCARRIIRAMEEPFVLGALPVDMRASIGIALFPGHGAEADQLIRKADVAVREAKKTGNGYALYSREQDRGSPRRLALAGELRRAIDDGRLQLYFQPKIDIRAGGVCGAEALTRWPHAEHGAISPAEFIPLAEHTGLIRPLTDWALQAACRQSHAWRQAAIDIPIAVNLSARNLRDPRLLDKIEGLCRTWGVDAGMLELEITESAIMDDPAGALDILAHLHGLGVPIHIDDFGTGYSSLGYLKKLPVDGVKIDQSFVFDMLTDKDSMIIVRSTITLAHDLGLKVVAEGVENQATLDRLAALGCDVAQGFYIGKPMPEEQFREWLRQSPWGAQKTR